MLAGVDVPGMPARMDVTRAGRVRVRIAHNAQDAGKIRLQHLDNNHPDARAKDPQAEPHRPTIRSAPGPGDDYPDLLPAWCPVNDRA
jgi:hypothetical protein